MAASSTASQGALGRLAIKTGTAYAADPAAANWAAGSPTAWPFTSEGIVKQEQILDTQGIRGTRTHSEEQTRAGTYTIGGTLTLTPSPELLENFLPLILGTAKDSDGGGSGIDRYTTGESLILFSLLIDKVGAIFEFRECQIARAVFTGTKDQLVSMSLDIQAREQAVESTWQSNIAAIGTSELYDPYVFHDCDIEADGVADLPINGFTLTIDNSLDVQHRNTQRPASIVPQDRVVTLSVPVPFNSGNYTEFYGSTSQTTSQLKMNNGTYRCDFEMGQMSQTKRTPVVSGKSEIGLMLEYQARATSYVAGTPTSHDIYVDLDSTT